MYVCVYVCFVLDIYIKEKYDERYNKGIRLDRWVVDKTGINSIESCDTPPTNETNLLKSCNCICSTNARLAMASTVQKTRKQA